MDMEQYSDPILVSWAWDFSFTRFFSKNRHSCFLGRADPGRTGPLRAGHGVLEKCLPLGNRVFVSPAFRFFKKQKIETGMAGHISPHRRWPAFSDRSASPSGLRYRWKGHRCIAGADLGGSFYGRLFFLVEKRLGLRPLPRPSGGKTVRPKSFVLPAQCALRAMPQLRNPLPGFNAGHESVQSENEVVATVFFRFAHRRIAGVHLGLVSCARFCRCGGMERNPHSLWAALDRVIDFFRDFPGFAFYVGGKTPAGSRQQFCRSSNNQLLLVPHSCPGGLRFVPRQRDAGQSEGHRPCLESFAGSNRIVGFLYLVACF